MPGTVRWWKRCGADLLVRRRSGFARAEAGAAAVEFALILPMLLLMVLGITELGRIVHYRSVLESASRTGVHAARSLSLSTSALITTAETTMTTAATTAITNSGITSNSSVGNRTYTPSITCECADGTSVDCATGTCVSGSKRYIATMTVSFPYTPVINLTNLPGGFNIDLSMTLSGNAILWVQ